MSLAAYLLATLFSVLIWLGAFSWSWSRDDYHVGLFPEEWTAATALVSVFLPYWALLQLARRFRDDPDGLLLWWMIGAPIVAITLFVGLTLGLPWTFGDRDRLEDLVGALLGGITKYGLYLAAIYGYTGHLLLKLPRARAA